MSDSEHARMLLRMAQKDLKAAEGMVIDKIQFENEIFGFHCQQAVEKALKALMSFHDVVYLKIHDIEELFSMLATHKINVPKKYNKLVDLTDFAVQFRYESFEDFGEEIDRGMVSNLVKDFVGYIDKKVNIV